MKRQKTKKQIKTRPVKNKPLQKKQIQQKTFFEKYSAPYSIWILIGLLLVIGFIVFGKYLTSEYLFFFKDIGSDSINQDYPAVMHKIFLSKEGFFQKYSFFSGMGDIFYYKLPVEPYGLFRTFLTNIGISVWGEQYLINSRFPVIFVFNILLSGIIFYFYLRTINVKKFSTLIGALLLTFSGYLIVGSSWGFAGHVFRAVFLLFAFEQLFIKKRWYFFPFAIIFASENLFILYIYSVFLLIYTVFRFTSTSKAKFSDFLKLTGKMILLGTAGLLMNISKTSAGFIKMFFSPRVAGNASFGSENVIEQSNLGSTTLLRFFSSDILGTGSNFKGWSNYFEAPLFYIGLLTLLLVPQVFIHLNKRRKIIFGSFLGFWVLTLLVPYLRHAFLAFTGDYFRYGFDFFIPFTLLFFSIYALNEIDKKFKLNLLLLAGTVLVLFAVLFFPYKSIPLTAIDNSLRKIIVLLLILYSGLIFLMSKPKYKSFAQIGIIILLVVELSYFSHKSYKSRDPVTKKDFTENAGGYKDGTIKAVEYIKSIDKTPFYRTEKDYQSGNAIHGSLNDAQAQGYYGTTNYSSFNQLNYIRFLEETELIQKGNETATRWVTGFRGNPLLQTFGNVKYHLSKNENPQFLRSGFDSLSRKFGITILKNRFYLPFGYTYDKYINYEDFKQLTSYSVTRQSLNNIQQEFVNLGNPELGEYITTALSQILNKQFPEKEDFLTETEAIIGKELLDKIKLNIIKHCVNTFSEQELFLNGFVYEKDNNLELSDFEKLSPNDSNIFIPAQKFNFEIYGKFVTNLRKDTLQIKTFSNSRITGSIKLPKTKMLFLTIPFDNGWKIKVNGKDEKFSRVNLGFTGIVLPEGKHELEIYYVPQYSKITTIVSIISIILFWLFLGYDIYRKRKKKRKIN